MTTSPLVTVGVPVYNRGHYVLETVDSLLKQDYANIELIIIDDGSTDDSWEKICGLEEACRKRFSNVRFVHQSNAGVAVTRLRLLELAHGEYFTFCDSDDLLFPCAVTALVTALQQTPECGIAVGESEVIDQDGRKVILMGRYQTWNDCLAARTGVAFGSAAYGTYSEILKNNHVVNGYMIRMSVLQDVVPYTPMAPLEDHWLHMQLSKVTKYLCVRSLVYRYRQHSGNAMADGRVMKRRERQTYLYEAECVRKMSDKKCWRIFTSSVGAVCFHCRFGSHVMEFLFMRHPLAVSFKIRRS